MIINPDVAEWLGVLGLLGLLGLVAIRQPVDSKQPGKWIRMLSPLGLLGLAGFWLPGAGAMGAFGALGLWQHQKTRWSRCAWLGWSGCVGLAFLLGS